MSALYLRQGLLASSGPIPFVGRVAYFAGSSADSTLALVTISFPSSALEFVREGDRYRAGYSVIADLKTQVGPRRVVDARESVRVLSWQETQRHEESVIFQRFFHLQPGTHLLSLSVRDQVDARTSSYEKEIIVPNPRAQGISTALVVYEADLRSAVNALPRFVASPRSAGLFGRDSSILAYVETYGSSAGPMVHYSVVNEAGNALLSDSTSMTAAGSIASALVKIPVTSVGIGVGRLQMWVPGGRDTTRTPLFVGFGDELPVASFSDMLNYLRYYVNPDRLATLRSAPETAKAAMWATLLRESDPVPTTPQHEGLLAYFDRVEQANDRFRGEASDGWLTDRGKVWITLGPPDQLSAGPPSQVLGRGVRTMVWEYQRHSVKLYFQDRTGLGRWTLDAPSEVEFNNVAPRQRIG